MARYTPISRVNGPLGDRRSGHFDGGVVPDRNVEAVAGWRGRALVPVLVFAAMVVAIIGTVGSPMIPTIAEAQAVPLGTAQWILTATLLVGAVAVPVTGRLGDGPGRRRVILACLGLVSVGAALSALAPTFAVLLAGRALQGLGQGLVPLTIAVARGVLPTDQLRPAIAALSVSTAAGAGLGFPVSGLIGEAFGYRAAFWFAALVAAVAFALVAAVVPPVATGISRPLDVLGALWLGATLLCLLLAVSQGQSWDWVSPPVLALLAAAPGFGAVWVKRELRVPHPLVDLRLLAIRPVLAANAAAVLLGVGLYALFSLVNRYVQTPPEIGYGYGASLVVTGLTLTPLSLGSVAASRVAARVSPWVGPGRLLAFGALVVAADLAVLALARGELWRIFAATAVAGVGVGATFATMPALIVRSVPPAETGSAASLNQVLIVVGGAIGSATSIALVGSFTTPGQAYPPETGYTVAFAAGAAVCILAAVVAIVLMGASPGDDARSRPSDSADLVTAEAP